MLLCCIPGQGKRGKCRYSLMLCKRARGSRAYTWLRHGEIVLACISCAACVRKSNGHATGTGMLQHINASHQNINRHAVNLKQAQSCCQAHHDDVADVADAQHARGLIRAQRRLCRAVFADGGRQRMRILQRHARALRRHSLVSDCDHPCRACCCRTQHMQPDCWACEHIQTSQIHQQPLACMYAVNAH